MATLPSASTLHIVLFPFMAKGHTIPILHLARHLLGRHAAVTLFTTPANRLFISEFLCDTEASVLDLPFEHNIPEIPSGVESTDKLPCMSLFCPFLKATKLIQPNFEKKLSTLLPHVHCIVSDNFLPWTAHSAAKFGIPRLAFSGMNSYVNSVNMDLFVNGVFSLPESDDDPFSPPNFPWIKLTRNHFPEPFNQRQPKGPYWDFLIEVGIAMAKSRGILIDSFYELEPLYFDYWNKDKGRLKAWCIGPLCLAEPPKPKADDPPNRQKPKWIEWLDCKLAAGVPVLYVAFGTQAELSEEQLREMGIGLEESNVNFLWVVRKNEWKLEEGFEERVSKRGLVVRDWVNQREILGHESVKGFLSHCGWNSVLESICAEVPILAWPMMAEQPLNANMLVEELKIGLRVETWNGSAKGFVKWEKLQKEVRELMEGEKGEELRKNVREISEAAKTAMAEDGSSSNALNQIMHEISTCTNTCDMN